MPTEEHEPVAVSRRISAPARDIFALLADPARHPDLDGSGMLRAAVSRAIVAAVGDVFVMKMCSRAPEDERASMDNGSIWVESMTKTLERLDGLCARQPGGA